MAKQRQKKPPRAKAASGFIVGGVQPVAEALRSEHVQVEAITVLDRLIGSIQLEPIVALAKQQKIRLRTCDEKNFIQLVGIDSHQGVAATIASLPSCDLDALAAMQDKPNLVALDQVQDPMNLGAVLRSANGFGIGAVVCPRDNATPVTTTCIKASAGAALHTPVVYVTNLSRTLIDLKEKGYWVVALTGGKPDGRELYELSKIKDVAPWILLAGSEGRGIRPLVLSQADYKVTIPMRGSVSSFNVSNACAMALYHLSHN